MSLLVYGSVWVSPTVYMHNQLRSVHIYVYVGINLFLSCDHKIIVWKNSASDSFTEWFDANPRSDFRDSIKAIVLGIDNLSYIAVPMKSSPDIMLLAPCSGNDLWSGHHTEVKGLAPFRCKAFHTIWHISHAMAYDKVSDKLAGLVK